jgi:hypothetical protein
MLTLERSAKPAIASVLGLRLVSCLLVLCGLILGASDLKTQQAKSPALPEVMRFCGPAHCATLTWNNGHYDAVYDDTPGTSTYTVELFTAEAVRIVRHEKGGDTAVLTGRISAQGNSIVDGKLTWTSGPTGTFPFTMTWGLNPAQPKTEGDRPPFDSPDIPAAAAGTQPDVTTVPLLLNECEPVGPNKLCGTWTWDGEKYLSVWDQGTVAHMSVQQWNSAGVILKRSDYALTAGTTATYTGHWQKDGTILGEAAINWPGHFPNSPLGPGNFKITWEARIENAKGPSYVRCDIKAPPPETSADPETKASNSFRAGNMESGACWTRIAALQGKAKSQTLYGYYLIVGRGVAKNPAQAFEWTQKAASQGQMDAEFNLAKMYKDGVGVPPDPAKSEYWTRQAKSQAQNEFVKTLARARQIPLGFNIVAAADTCRQDPENARAFSAECAAALGAENSYLRQKALDVAEEECRDTEKRENPNPNYPPDFSSERFRECMDRARTDVRARFGDR